MKVFHYNKLKSMPIFTLDGNIGSEKSTILEYLHRHYVIPIDFDPSNKLLLNSNGENKVHMFLERFWIQPKEDSIIIMETSPYFQKKVYIPFYIENNTLTKTEVDSLVDIFESNAHIWTPNVYIYLRSNPDKCNERIAINNISVDTTYIHQLHNLYENSYYWAAAQGYPIICVDVENKSIDKISQEIIQILGMMGLNKVEDKYVFTSTSKQYAELPSDKSKPSVASRLRESAKMARNSKANIEISMPKYKILQRPQVIDHDLMD